MKVLIIGAAGMIGRKLTEKLLIDKKLNGSDITSLCLVDVIEPSTPEHESIAINALAADLSAPGVSEQLIADQPDVIYHLAAVVSGEAETDMPKGYRINLDGTRFLVESIRQLHETHQYYPKVIFSSSIAVFGAPFPDPIPEDFHLTPLTSYGAQKAMGELLLADYHRRGLLQGIALRLPTICIRPGKPNQAASGFFSGILREPINGQTANLPVEDTVRHWFASPRAAVGFMLHAATLSSEQLGQRCVLNLPGLSVTVAEQLESLERVVGTDALKLVTRVPDESIRKIVKNWAQSIAAEHAIQLGFTAEHSFDDIVRVYLEDEMPA